MGHKPLEVVELFAGVGGFRLGLEGAPAKKKRLTKYKVVWSNQWEPSTKIQHASDIYVKKFGKKYHSNEDIAKVGINDIPNHNVFVGGFPCQDYSVARTLSQAAGIIGKKGVLWWQIHRILKGKELKPEYLILENVDRLLKSPAHQRGRDFAIMLASLADLGYAVEWRVINAADYGFPQRRRRIFILGYHNTTKIYDRLYKREPASWILNGVIARAFPVKEADHCKSEFNIKGKLPDITDSFGRGEQEHVFYNAGMMINKNVVTIKVVPNYHGEKELLKNILVNEKNVPEKFVVDERDLPKWKFLKGAKSITRQNKRTGHHYTYDEGSMAFPDPLDQPARTIVTGEGGSTPSRFKHIIKVNGRFRRLTPTELEKLNGFPPGFTEGEGLTDINRAFFMGNALVVGVVKKIGESLIKEHRRRVG